MGKNVPNHQPAISHNVVDTLLARAAMYLTKTQIDRRRASASRDSLEEWPTEFPTFVKALTGVSSREVG